MASVTRAQRSSSALSRNGEAGHLPFDFWVKGQWEEEITEQPEITEQTELWLVSLFPVVP